jgi:hypothetical protein
MTDVRMQKKLRTSADRGSLHRLVRPSSEHLHGSETFVRAAHQKTSEFLKGKRA